MFWRKSEKQIVDEMLDELDPAVYTGDMALLPQGHNRIIRAVIADLRRGGHIRNFNPIALLQLIMQIVQLIDAGLKTVREIVEAIRGRKQ